LIAIEPGNVVAVEQLATLGGAIEAAKQIHEGRFTRPTRTHEGDEFPAPDLEGNATHGVHLHFSRMIGFVHILQPNDNTVFSHGNWASTLVAAGIGDPGPL